MRYRRLFALLLSAALLLCRLPAYALKDTQGSAAAPLDSGSDGTEAAEPSPAPESPPSGDAAQQSPPVVPPEPSLNPSLPENPPEILLPENSLGGAAPETAPPEYSGVLGGGPLAQLKTDRQPDGPVEIVLTEDWIIGDEQGLTTLSPQFADKSPSELANILGHPGITQPVTILTDGHQIVVRDGGSLSLSEFDANSAQLRVEGEYADGLFYVGSGGKLVLNQVLVETGGAAVYLEEGADYKWKNSNKDAKPYPEPLKAGGAAPLEAVELYAHPDPLLVFDDTAWSNLLPAEKAPSLKVFCSADGQREDKYRELKVAWDTETWSGALSRREDCVLEGSFHDEKGERIPSRFTPELPVRFVARAPVRLLKSRFTRTGAGNYYGQLRFELPREARAMRLEFSEDGRSSWRELEDASVVASEEEVIASFYQPDDRPRRYRLLVEGGPNEGASDPVTLPKPPTVGDSSGGKTDDSNDDGGDDDGNDFSGNRGGGTTLDPPERELTSSAPESQADAPAASSSAEVSTSSPAPTERTERQASIAGRPQAQPDAPEPPVTAVSANAAVSGTPDPDNIASSHTEPQARPAAAPAGDADRSEQPPRTFPPAGQAAAAAAGVAACGGAGALAASQTLRGKLLSALRKLLSWFKQ